MKITKRKAEIASLVELLESDAFPDAEALALAVFQQAADLIEARHLYALVSRDYPDVAWGPYATVNEAEKAWEDTVGPAIGAGGGFVLPIAPWSHDTASSDTASTVVYPTTPCSTCGHPKWHHLDTTKGRSTKTRTTRCCSPKVGCTCPAFTVEG